jgi:hypothetical protein
MQKYYAILKKIGLIKFTKPIFNIKYQNYPSKNPRINSLTVLGLALPFVSFIT